MALDVRRRKEAAQGCPSLWKGKLTQDGKNEHEAVEYMCNRAGSLHRKDLSCLDGPPLVTMYSPRLF